jgi:hypothetical protein
MYDINFFLIKLIRQVRRGKKNSREEQTTEIIIENHYFLKFKENSSILWIRPLGTKAKYESKAWQLLETIRPCH